MTLPPRRLGYLCDLVGSMLLFRRCFSREKMMERIAFTQLLLFGVEILTTSVFLLGLFRLRQKLGLVPFYMALGALQQLQAILALTVYLQVMPGIVVSPGSSVLLTGVL